MKVLVTGGAGFIGSHVVDALADKGHQVHVLDNLSTGQRSNVRPGVPLHELDLRDPQAAQLMRDQRFEALFHLAAQMDVRRSVADPAYDADVNVLGTLNILEAGRQAGLRKVVFASTGGACYGEQDTFPAPETHPLRPISPYGISKVTVERYLHYYHVVHGLPYVALRFANVYGPRQSTMGEAGVVAIFAKRLLGGQPCTINGDGLQTRDFVHVQDVVQANLLALDHPTGGDVFNVGMGTETTVVELYDHLNRLTGANIPAQHAPAKAGEQRRSVLAADKLRQTLGWQPHYTLATGLADTVSWFKTTG